MMPTFLKWFEDGEWVLKYGNTLPFELRHNLPASQAKKVPKYAKENNIFENLEPCGHCRATMDMQPDVDSRVACLIPSAESRQTNQNCLLCTLIGYKCDAKGQDRRDVALDKADELLEGEFEDDQKVREASSMLEDMGRLEEEVLETIRAWSDTVSMAPEDFRRSTAATVSTSSCRSGFENLTKNPTSQVGNYFAPIHEELNPDVEIGEGLATTRFKPTAFNPEQLLEFYDEVKEEEFFEEVHTAN